MTREGIHMDRAQEWQMFSDVVLHHIKTYTIPQYGDAPEDQLMEFSPEDCIKSIKRYANRHFSGQRGPVENQRDLLKMAHYIAVCFFKERY